MQLTIISDNHSNYDFEIPTPKGDVTSVLIHAGDFSYMGNNDEIIKFTEWMKSQDKFDYKLWIPGNHEIGIEKNYQYYVDFIESGSNSICIHNKEIEIDGLKFMGTGNTPTFGRWAFMLDDEQRKRYWENAPEDVSILVSHGPMWGILDTVDGLEIEPGKLEHLGCVYLRKYIERVQPKLCCFGHIHDSHGQMTLKAWEPNEQNTLCVNASLLDEEYKLVNKPVVVEI